MTFQEQAQELVDSFKPYADSFYDYDYDESFLLKSAKSIAHIAMDLRIEDRQNDLSVTTSEPVISIAERKLHEYYEIKQLINLTT
jgi:hypothetical protein